MAESKRNRVKKKYNTNDTEDLNKVNEGMKVQAGWKELLLGQTGFCSTRTGGRKISD